MTRFVKSGATYNLASEEALVVLDELPLGTYSVKYDNFNNRFYLEKIDGFTLPPKIYGNTIARAERILNTFRDRGKSTGVLLAGEKGSGKTMLAEYIAESAGYPVIVVNEAHFGDAFNQFMQLIDQPAVVLFDEFEKVYDVREAQPALLTLLDGLYTSNKLYLFTVNDVHYLDRHMMNRPGRILYHLSYGALDPEFVREYAEDTLKNQEHVDSLVSLSSIFTGFSFDILKAMVEDMNRYNETAHEVLVYLNADPARDGSGASYSVEKLEVFGVAVTQHEKEVFTNPLSNLSIEYSSAKPKKKSAADAAFDDAMADLMGAPTPSPYMDEDISFSQSDLVEAKNGVLKFRNAKGAVTIRKREIVTPAYYSAF